MITELTATQIDWDVTTEEIRERLKKLPTNEREDWFGEETVSMNMDEFEEVALEVFHHSPGLLDDFLELPTSVNIPHGITEKEDITDWLSDTYGYCINEYRLETRYPEQEDVA